MIKDKIKALLKLHGKGNKDGAAALGMPYHSFANKINQREFNTSELIRLADLTGTTLAFIDENGKPIIEFDINDLDETTEK